MNQKKQLDSLEEHAKLRFVHVDDSEAACTAPLEENDSTDAGTELNVLPEQSVAIRPPESDQHSQRLLAKSFRRLCAIAVDQLICIVTSGLLALPMIAFYDYYLFEVSHYYEFSTGDAWTNVALCCWTLFCLLVSTWFWLLFYYPRFESSTWQGTPGKILMGLQVVDNNGHRLTEHVAFWRRIGQITVFTIMSVLSILGVARLLMLTGNTGLAPFPLLAAPFVAGFLVSLISIRGKTLFDIFANRVIMLDDGRREEQCRRFNFAEMCKIIFLKDNCRPRWLLFVCLGWSLYSFFSTLAGCGRMYTAMSDMNTAFAATSDVRALKQNPHYVRAVASIHDVGALYYALSALHDRLGDPRAQEEDLQKAVILSPDNPAYHSGLAQAFRHKGDLQAAAQELEKSIDLTKRAARNSKLYPGLQSSNADFAQCYCQLADIYRQLGQFEQALACCSTAITIEPAADKYAQRAAVYRAKHDEINAQRDDATAKSMMKVDTPVGNFAVDKGGNSKYTFWW